MSTIKLNFTEECRSLMTDFANENSDIQVIVKPQQRGFAELLNTVVPCIINFVNGLSVSDVCGILSLLIAVYGLVSPQKVKIIDGKDNYSFEKLTEVKKTLDEVPDKTIPIDKIKNGNVIDFCAYLGLINSV